MAELGNVTIHCPLCGEEVTTTVTVTLGAPTPTVVPAIINLDEGPIRDHAQTHALTEQRPVHCRHCGLTIEPSRGNVHPWRHRGSMMLSCGTPSPRTPLAEP